MKSKKLTTFLANMGIIIVSETAMATGEFGENEIDAPKKGISVALTEENKMVLEKKKIFQELQLGFKQENNTDHVRPPNCSCIPNHTCMPIKPYFK